MKKLILILGLFTLCGCVKEEIKAQNKTKTVYYRLKQVDKDGTVTYSKILITKE